MKLEELHVNFARDPKNRAALTLQETRSIHDSMNLPKIEFIAYIEIIYNLGDKPILCLIFNRINVFWSAKRKSGTASVNTNSQWSKQEACFARATQVWFAVNHNTSVTSGE